MKELVSVIILSYKNIDGIYETLDSVLSQTYENIEIVVSDDGTPGFEDAADKIQGYITAGNKGNIKNVLINPIKVNGGTVKNINSAIEKSAGKYIKVLAAEDMLSCDNALDIYVSFMENNDFKIAFAKIRGITQDGEYRDQLLACESDYNLLKTYSPEDTKNRLFRRNFLPAPAWIIDRKLFEENGLFREDTRIIEDYPYWIYLSMRGVQFGYIDEFLVNYKFSGVSSGGSYSEMFMNDMLIIYDKYIFPYDKKFGILQPVYNCLKRAGLNFYMSKAKWGKMTKSRKIVSGIKYFPFMIYVKLQNHMIDRKNKKAAKGK